jgi:phosphoglucosamine mutase
MSQNPSPDAAAPATRRYFGTDGVRGVANTELSAALALALGAAAARVLGENGAGTEIVVGRDTRISGDLLESALIAGICSQGMNVVRVGVLPTPGVAFVTRTRPSAAAGAVLSASHNPFEDNGIKFFGADGRKLSDAVEARIEAVMAEWETLPRPSGAGVGRVIEAGYDVERYADDLKAAFGNERLAGLRLVVDGSNGAASFLGPVVLGELGAEVVPFHCKPDGVNINDGCGSLHPEGMAAKVVAEGAFAGFAFDGDADRVILADARGRIFDGDRVLCAAGIHLKSQGRLTNDTVVGTIMSNMGLEAALRAEGIHFVRAKVGDRYVMEEMTRHGATLGGEKSGHLLFTEFSTTGDGLLTAIQMLRVCRESGKTLADWSDRLHEYPQRLISVPVRERDGWERNAAISAAVSAAESRLGDRGRINVRPSGTEKKIRVMVEGPDPAEVEEAAESVAGIIRAELGV